MQSDDIAPAVRSLINRHIRSMDHAEAVLHLAAAPSDAHDAAAVAARYRWGRGIAKQVLGDLTESGIATLMDGAYRLAPDSADPTALAGLRDLYHRQPVTLVRAIYAAPSPFRPLTRPASPRDDTSSAD